VSKGGIGFRGVDLFGYSTREIDAFRLVYFDSLITMLSCDCFIGLKKHELTICNLDDTS